MNDNDSTEFQELIDTSFKLLKVKKDDLPDKEEKRAWWRMLRGFDLAEIKYAFGVYTTKYKSQPSPSHILDVLKELHSDRKKAQKENAERLEAEKQAALPPPTHAIDVIEELAKAQLGENATSHDILLERHYQLIAQDKRKGLIRSPNRGSEATCAVNHCHKAGSVTGSLKGSDNWYCPEHARLS